MWRSVPLIIVTILYVVQAGVFYWTKDYPQAIVLGGYALANIGLIQTM